VSLASGIGSVHRTGPAWEGISGTTDRALVLGGSARLHAFGTRVSYGIDVESFISRASYEYAGKPTPTRLHGDLISALVLNLSL
jgi:hypothetical protein